VDRAVCPRPHEELAAADQVTAETEPPVFDRDPHLAEPRDEIFLHLTGHPRLLHSRKTGRVGVGIGGNGAVQFRRFVDADAFADFVIVASQALD